MKDIKDYLHLYIGCEAEINIKHINNVPTFLEDGITTIEGYIIDCINAFNYVKPILRPLSDMTEEELGELRKINTPQTYDDGFHDQIMNDAARTLYLLKQGFDLFQMIEAGLAIDKTKQPA